jgi:hypothetical protein
LKLRRPVIGWPRARGELGGEPQRTWPRQRRWDIGRGTAKERKAKRGLRQSQWRRWAGP